ncbi:MAG TPA: heme exporter protein CcmD [Patescibacteria group bacterium]|nr:heme exporter protein CcmD [Patescibacteria group bacterium]
MNHAVYIGAAYGITALALVLLVAQSLIGWARIRKKGGSDG